jgi:hypothetical protein
MDNKIVELKGNIECMIININSSDFFFENDIINFIDTCHILNKYLNNEFFDDILYDTLLKYNNNYDKLYIFENIEKIKKFVNVI